MLSQSIQKRLDSTLCVFDGLHWILLSRDKKNDLRPNDFNQDWMSVHINTIYYGNRFSYL